MSTLFKYPYSLIEFNWLHKQVQKIEAAKVLPNKLLYQIKFFSVSIANFCFSFFDNDISITKWYN